MLSIIAKQYANLQPSKKKPAKSQTDYEKLEEELHTQDNHCLYTRIVFKT